MLHRIDMLRVAIVVRCEWESIVRIQAFVRSKLERRRYVQLVSEDVTLVQDSSRKFYIVSCKGGDIMFQ